LIAVGVRDRHPGVDSDREITGMTVTDGWDNFEEPETRAARERERREKERHEKERREGERLERGEERREKDRRDEEHR
jgi:hypothetical protein